MPIRDIVVTALVLASLPLILRKPFFGILVWTWLSLMNPHKLCWGFAWGLPFAQVVAITLLISLLLNKKEPKKIPWTPISKLLVAFWVWMLITTMAALYPMLAWEQFDKIWKILLLVFITMMLLTSKVRINALVWVMMVSLGLYGVKGGIFTLTTGGGDHVLGPQGTFIGGNNEIGLALIMTVPFMRYVQLSTNERWLKNVMTISMVLTIAAILGTQSRGALLGLAVMTLFLLKKSRKKFVLLLMLALALPVLYNFMPQSWHDRMATIDTYQEDKSAMGRIIAWRMGWHMALARPLGGGFWAFQPATYAMYDTQAVVTPDAHSIYFKVLGEHGFVGLGLFLGLGAAALLAAQRIVRKTKDEPRLFWMRDLASMIYVSLIGYATAGAFLGLSYFDYYYTILAVLVGLQRLLKQYEEEGLPEQEPLLASTGRLAWAPAYARKPGPTLAPRKSWTRQFKIWYDEL